MSDYGPPLIWKQLKGIPVRTIGVSGSGAYYDPQSFNAGVASTGVGAGNVSVGSGNAFQQAFNDQKSGSPFNLSVISDGGPIILDGQVIFPGTSPVMTGEGQDVSQIDCSYVANLGLESFTTNGLSNVQHGYFANLSWIAPNATTLAAAVAVTVTGSTPFVYTHGTTGTTPATQSAYVFVTGGSCSSATLQQVSSASANLLGGGNATSVQITIGGVWMNVGDVLTVNYSSTPTVTYQYDNAFLNLTTQNYQQGSETGSLFLVDAVSWNNTTNIGVVRAGMTFGTSACFDGCEDAIIRASRILSGNAITWQCYGGAVTFLGGKYGHLGVSGTHVTLDNIVGSDVVWTAQGAGNHTFDVMGMMNNGAQPVAAFTFNTVGNCSVNLYGGTWFGGGTSATASTCWFGGTTAGLAATSFNFGGINLFSGTNTTTNQPLFLHPPASVSGWINSASSNSTNSSLATGITTGSFYFNRNGTITQCLNGVLLSGGALGNPANLGIAGPINLNTTSTAILTVAPPVQGFYRVSVGVLCKTNSTPTVTITYKDQSEAGTTTITFAPGAMTGGNATGASYIISAGVAASIVITGTDSVALGDGFATAMVEFL